MMKNRHLIVTLMLVLVGTSFLSYDADAGTTNEVQAGRQLYEKLKCAACHSIEDVGGCIAPPLVNVTRRRTPEYLNLRLSADKEDEFIELVKHPELFPHPRFQSAQVQLLIAYLKTLESKSAR